MPIRLTSDDGDSKPSKEFRDKMKYLQLQTKFIEAAFSEIKSFSQSAVEVRRTGNLGDLPLVVLTAGKDLEASAESGVRGGDARVQEKLGYRSSGASSAAVHPWKADCGARQHAHDSDGSPEARVKAIREVSDAAKMGAPPKG